LKLIWDQDTYTDMTNKISSVDGLYGDNTYDSVWSFQTKYNEINVDNQIAVDWKAWIETIPAMNSVLETIS
jgi:cystathionine beta-lyase family protein involved in aluminum resistance